jgi:AraC family transcriptional regulator
MIESTCATKGMLEGVLSESSAMTDDHGDMFRLVVAMAVQSCSGKDGGLGMARAPAMTGGLATWQLQRALALMMEAVGGQLSVTRIAHECGLSYSHFSKAFRNSVGVSPLTWLCKLRIDRAKWLLLNTDQTLVEIASACGFSGHCYFTRTFARMVGMPPKLWRRAFGAGSQRCSRAGARESALV